MRAAFLDLETLGTGPSPAIVQIGLVIFDTTLILDRRSIRIDWGVDLEAGGELDPACLRWWLRQPARCQDLAEDTFSTAPERALDVVTQTCLHWDVGPVWANGCDWGWLEAAYRRHKLPIFWSYNAVRDLRTLRKTVCAGIEVARDEATMHDALTDALWGACLVQEMHQQKGGIL